MLSCSHSETKVPPISGESTKISHSLDRAPAGGRIARTRNCAHSMIDFVQANLEKRGIIARYAHFITERMPLLRMTEADQIEENLEAYKKAVWNLHDNKGRGGQLLAGDSGRRAKFLAALKIRNRNRVLPAYYQFWDGKESFETIDNIVNGGDLSSSAATAAKANLDKWLDEYVMYESRLNKKIEEGFAAILQLQAYANHRPGGLREFIAGKTDGKDVWRFEDFRGSGPQMVSKNIKIPKIRNGKVYFEDTDISQWSQWQGYIEDAELARKHVFSSGFGLLDEMNQKSEIYRIQIEQYHMHRRLTFLYERLHAIPNAELSSEQNKLMGILKNMLNNDKYYPPSFAVEKGQKAEIAAEIRATRTSTKSKHKIRARFKQDLTKKTLEAVEESERSAWQIMRKYVMFAGLGAGGAFGAHSYYTVLPQLYQNPYLSWPLAWVENAINNAQLELVGITYPIIKCADEHRNWTKEEICVPDVVHRHTSRLFFESQMDPSYNYLEDEEYIETRRKVIRSFLSLQADRKYLEMHAAVKDYLLNEGRPEFADEVYLELLKAEHDLNDIQFNRVAHILDIYAIDGRTPQLDSHLRGLQPLAGGEIAENIKNYFKVRDQYLEYMTEHGRLPVEDIRSFENMFEIHPISDETRQKLEDHLEGKFNEYNEDANAQNGRHGPGHRPSQYGQKPHSKPLFSNPFKRDDKPAQGEIEPNE